MNGPYTYTEEPMKLSRKLACAMAGQPWKNLAIRYQGDVVITAESPEWIIKRIVDGLNGAYMMGYASGKVEAEMNTKLMFSAMSGRP